MTRDLDVVRGFYIVSDKCRDVMVSIDRMAFEFLECQCFDKKGKRLERRWLCDVVRVVNIVDEDRVQFRIVTGSHGERYYIVNAYDDIFFKEHLVDEGAHIFNMRKFCIETVVDETFQNAFKAHGLKKNFSFEDTARRSRRYGGKPKAETV